ncbi:MAG TPA: DUF6151 family protein [Ramlibacter sp.]|jgi:hypothetical protein|uniref:DUF6151 family protein n=1 Tax=Ramlibacter sp. TaxID=1917967 RepID=UPI002D6650DE|nr:DUF6151 family protein [Ramlibacter sp.]HZY18556.1 DUF6151 family protein [Ramlibacter sp.]
MNHALRCRCGTLQGHVATPGMAGRALCYCKDCQAFARFLGRQGDVLDPHGGTEIIPLLPEHVRITAGADQLACMSLGPRGLLRWYAACCRTPIGNTTRDIRMAYVGVIRACLPGDEAGLARSFGPLRIRLNTASALGQVPPTRLATGVALVRIMRAVLAARLRGRYRDTPFFDPATGTPVRAPQVLGLAERQALERAA